MPPVPVPVCRSVRRFDVVVFGATGFTGRLVAEYLSSKRNVGPHPLRWAVAGRDSKKLLALQKDLGAIGVAPEIIEANSNDPQSLANLSSQTKVVLTTVGPYQLYGEPLVKACAENGSDYVDLTGEPAWHSDMIRRYHDIAQSNGSLIVPQCGFDSLPSDLGTLFVVDYLRHRYNTGTKSVLSHFSFKGGSSGGTILSALTMLETPGAIAKAMDPYLLNPEPSHSELRNKPREEEKDVKFLSWDQDVKKWNLPFFMASTNTKVVRRSAALRQIQASSSSSSSSSSIGSFVYGRDFAYNEVWSFTSNFVIAFFSWLCMVAGFGLIAFPLTRPIVRRFLPSPGQGPSAEVRSRSWFKNLIVATGEGGQKVQATVTGKCPGYGDTAKMISEAALTLAEDREKIPYKGGVLTPATVMGQLLIERLNRVGIEFKIVDEQEKKQK